MQVFVKAIPPLRPKVQVGGSIVENLKDVIHLFQFLPKLFGGQNGIGDFVDKTGQARIVVKIGFHPGTGSGQSISVFVKLAPGVFQSLFLPRSHALTHGGAGIFGSRFDTAQGIGHLVDGFRTFSGSLGRFLGLVDGLRRLVGSGGVGGGPDIDV